MPSTLPIPSQPLRLALIGADARSQTIYQPLWESLKPWCVPVAVCDPIGGGRRRLGGGPSPTG